MDGSSPIITALINGHPRNLTLPLVQVTGRPTLRQKKRRFRGKYWSERLYAKSSSDKGTYLEYAPPYSTLRVHCALEPSARALPPVPLRRPHRVTPRRTPGPAMGGCETDGSVFGSLAQFHSWPADDAQERRIPPRRSFARADRYIGSVAVGSAARSSPPRHRFTMGLL